MDWSDVVRAALSRRRRSPDDDVVLELAQHAAAAYEAARAEGLDDGEAHARASSLVDAWAADGRVAGRRPSRAPVLPPPAAASRGAIGVWFDLLYGLRLMRRQPAATLLTIATIALAVGATTTLASVSYGVLLRPLPWPEADRIVRVVETREGSTRPARFLTNVAVHSWSGAPQTIETIGAHAPGTVTLDTGAGPERVGSATVTAAVFDVLRVGALRGRVFTADDEIAANVALISYGLWQRAYGGGEDVLGRTIRVDGTPRTIVGVLPRRIDFPTRDTSVWLPMRVQPLQATPDGRQNSLQMFAAIARLAPGASAPAAAAEATAAVRNGPQLGMVGNAVFGSSGPAVVSVDVLQTAMTADVRDGLVLLLAGVVLLLVTSAAGIATMQIARAVARRREIAIRAAIGAGAGRLARQMLLEHVLAGLIGGACGIGIAALLHRALPSLLPAGFPRIDDVVLDWPVATLAAVLALVVGVAAGLFPALQAARVRLVPALTENASAPTGGRLRTPALRLRAAMIVAQVALSVLLLVGATLLARSFAALSAIDRGYDPNGVLVARLPLNGTTIPAAERYRLLDAITSRLTATAEVRAAGFGLSAPFMGGQMMSGFQLRAAESRTGEASAVQADVNLVSAGYFDALGMRILDGRGFTADDTATSEPVVVVNREFARRYLREPALDLRLAIGGLGRSPRDAASLPAGDPRVVGMVEDITPERPDDAHQPMLYRPASQISAVSLGDPTLVVRTAGEPSAIVPALKAIVRDVARDVPVDAIATLADRLDSSLARPRLYALLLGTFAGLALLVAGVGLFGVLAYSVASRRRELGVRLALGATPAGLVGLVLRQTLALALPGLLIGAGVAWMASAYTSSLLYGVSARDGLTYLMVSLAVLLAVAAAAALPAHRAASVDAAAVTKP